MTDTKIQRLRGISNWLTAMGWANMATNVREAADELERLDKIEAAASQVVASKFSSDPLATHRTIRRLEETLEANQCPTE